MLIRRVDSYMGPKGERIEALRLHDATAGEDVSQERAAAESIKEPLTVYAGVATIMSGLPGPGGQPIAAIPNELRFHIPADNLDQATEKYAEEFEKFVEDLKKENQQAAEDAERKAQTELYVPNHAESEAINNMKIVGADD